MSNIAHRASSRPGPRWTSAERTNRRGDHRECLPGSPVAGGANRLVMVASPGKEPRISRQERAPGHRRGTVVVQPVSGDRSSGSRRIPPQQILQRCHNRSAAVRRRRRHQRARQHVARREVAGVDGVHRIDAVFPDPDIGRTRLRGLAVDAADPDVGEGVSTTGPRRPPVPRPTVRRSWCARSSGLSDVARSVAGMGLRRGAARRPGRVRR